LAEWPRKKSAKTLFANANSNDVVTDEALEAFMASIPAGDLVTV